jgi:hypothetical protein
MLANLYVAVLVQLYRERGLRKSDAATMVAEFLKNARCPLSLSRVSHLHSEYAKESRTYRGLLRDVLPVGCDDIRGLLNLPPREDDPITATFAFERVLQTMICSQLGNGTPLH